MQKIDIIMISNMSEEDKNKAIEQAGTSPLTSIQCACVGNIFVDEQILWRLAGSLASEK